MRTPYKVWRGKDVTKLREKYVLSQKEFADMIHTFQSQVSRWETSFSKKKLNTLTCIALDAIEKYLADIS